MSWNSTVFSVCASGNSWLWAAWSSIDDAYNFLDKPEKRLEIDCLFFAEAPSKENAIKTARNLLGTNIKQIGNEWAAEVCKKIDKKPHIDTDRLASLAKPSKENLKTFLPADIPTHEQLAQYLL